MDQGWDLLDVVRGGSNNNMESLMSTNILESATSCLLPHSLQENGELFHSYPHLFETTTGLDELEELYKPFYPVLHPSFSSPSTTLTSCISLPQQAEIDLSQKAKNIKEPATKYKKRKNQQKREVKQVKEDGLCADMWAWRKYGQKPIKGSPYPRSYYRCSSSKGCSARKQVERNPSNPEIFIITYTAEHSHPHPTRRNSLSGSTRSKFLVSKTACSLQHLDDRKSSSTSDDMDIVSTKKEIVDQSDKVVQNGSTKRESEEVADETINLTPKPNHLMLRHDQMFPSIEDLERGLEELDEQTTFKKELSDGEFLDGFADDDHDHFIDADWFVDHYSTTLAGAC